MKSTEPKEYWNSLLSYMKREGMLRKYRESSNENRQIIDTWKGDAIRLAAGLNIQEDWIHVDITLYGAHRIGHFISLEKVRPDLENGVMSATSDLNNTDAFWIWEKYDDPKRKESHIILRKPANLTDRIEWKKQQEWLARTLVAFRNTFGSIVERW